VSAITTHVLDTALGRPAAGVPVVLETVDAQRDWHVVGRGITDEDGRLRNLMDSSDALVPGVYRLVFDTATYFDLRRVRAFYPVVVVTFSVMAGEADYHVPLLLGPFGYTTYRGS
jgi:hydroxyisourate hydrolase